MRPRTETYRGADGKHPDKDFYEPTEAFPEKDFAHVLGDGYVLVHYQPAIAPQEPTELRAFVAGPDEAARDRRGDAATGGEDQGGERAHDADVRPARCRRVEGVQEPLVR